jgi:hypothetical protein
LDKVEKIAMLLAQDLLLSMLLVVAVVLLRSMVILPKYLADQAGLEADLTMLVVLPAG